MTRGARLVAALVALGAFAGLVLLWRPSPRAGAAADVPAAESPPAAVPERLSAADAEAQLAAREALRDERDPTRPAKTAESSGGPAAPAATLTVSARVLDRAWRPIAGARLAWLEPVEGPGAPRIDVRREARADASGAVWLALERAELGSTTPVLLAASASGHLRLTRRLEPGELTGSVLNLGEWILPPGGDVAGRVVDARGIPVDGALVRLAPELGEATAEERAMARAWPLGGDVGVPGLLPIAFTGPDGRFALTGLPSGRFDVVAAALDAGPRLPARAERVVVTPGETEELGDLVLADAEPDELVTGRVLAPDGAPVEGAVVSLGTEHVAFPANARTTADGRFTLAAPPGLELRASARDPGDRWAPTAPVPVRAGDPEVELRFERPMPVREAPAEARDAAPAMPSDPSPAPAERPADEARLRGRFTLDGEPAHGWSASVLLRRRPLDHEGAFAIDGLRPREEHLVLSTRPGGSVVRVLVERVALAPGENEWSRELVTGTVVLEGLPSAAPSSCAGAGRGPPARTTRAGR